MEDVKLFESIYIPKAGGVTTTAATRTLAGGGGLRQIEIFLREAIQNSYDAKLQNKKPLSLGLNCYKLRNSNIEKIQTLFKDAGPVGKEFAKLITSNYYNVEVSDRNTTGLSGYSGFQEKISEEEEKFHHFIYMTGNDEIKGKESGGSFGFGKAALYKYSDLRTIVVYTRIKSQFINKFQSRFIICRLDERVKRNDGRCWWGTEGRYTDQTTYARPVTDSNADYLASLFGMKPFEDEETGTDILILNTIKNEAGIPYSETFSEELPVLLTHWFWPKIVSPNTEKKIKFELTLDGEDISDNIPSPDDTYPYSAFVKSYKMACDYYSHKVGSGSETNVNAVSIVKHGRPVVEVGGIFLRKRSASDFLYDKYVKVDWNKPTVALMRDVEFIVEYRPVEIDTSSLDTTRCFGVFHTNRIGHSNTSADEQEIEHYFRDIENQTHDKWTYVKDDDHPWDYLGTVNKAIPEAVRNYLDIKSSIGNTASISGLVAQKFGSKLGFGFGSGASDPMEELMDSNNRGEKKSSFVKKKVSPQLKIEKGKKLITLFYDAKILKDKKLVIEFTPKIKTIDGREPVENNELKIVLLTHVPNGRESTTISWKPVNGNIFKIDKSGVYSLTLEANINCAFDVSIKKEEVNG